MLNSYRAVFLKNHGVLVDNDLYIHEWTGNFGFIPEVQEDNERVYIYYMYENELPEGEYPDEYAQSLFSDWLNSTL